MKFSIQWLSLNDVSVRDLTYPNMKSYFNSGDIRNAISEKHISEREELKQKKQQEKMNILTIHPNLHHYSLSLLYTVQLALGHMLLEA